MDNGVVWLSFSTFNFPCPLQTTLYQSSDNSKAQHPPASAYTHVMAETCAKTLTKA